MKLYKNNALIVSIVLSFSAMSFALISFSKEQASCSNSSNQENNSCAQERVVNIHQESNIQERVIQESNSCENNTCKNNTHEYNTYQDNTCEYNTRESGVQKSGAHTGDMYNGNMYSNINDKKGVEKFVISLIIYKPNAPWIIQELLNMKLQHFVIAWKYVVDIITSENRWRYFCEIKEDFSQEKFNEQFLWQCKKYDQFLKHLYCNLSTQELVHLETDEDQELYKDNKELVSFLDYCELLGRLIGDKKLLLINARFYAFYCDCLNRLFYKTVNHAYQIKNDTQVFAKIIKELKLCAKSIEIILKSLQNTEYYSTYYFALKRYKEIITLLQEEKHGEIK